MRGAHPSVGATCALQGRTERGFTLVELVMVILLVGTLSYYAVARMSNRSDTDAHGFTQQLSSALRYAQKAAVAQRRTLYVNLDETTRRVWVCLDAAQACNQPLMAPAGGALEYTAPQGIALTTNGTAQLTFDALGRPSVVSTLDLEVSSGDTQFTLRLEPDSGYVRQL